MNAVYAVRMMCQVRLQGRREQKALDGICPRSVNSGFRVRGQAGVLLQRLIEKNVFRRGGSWDAGIPDTVTATKPRRSP